MEGHPKMTKARRVLLFILLLTLVHLTCAWAFLPSRHETFPSTQSFSLLSPWRTTLADTTDTTDTLSPASPQIIGSIEPAAPKLPADSLSSILPFDLLIL